MDLNYSHTHEQQRRSSTSPDNLISSLLLFTQRQVILPNGGQICRRILNIYVGWGWDAVCMRVCVYAQCTARQNGRERAEIKEDIDETWLWWRCDRWLLWWWWFCRWTNRYARHSDHSPRQRIWVLFVIRVQFRAELRKNYVADIFKVNFTIENSYRPSAASNDPSAAQDQFSV